MNVYIRELSRSMAEHGVEVIVFTRRTDDTTPEVTEVMPGFSVVHIDAGPRVPIPIREHAGLVGEFAEATVRWIDEQGRSFDLIHSHYWLSGWAGVLLKEKLGIPLANSFHTLGRVKDLTRHPDDAPEGALRTLTEEEVIARSDCVVASTPYEFEDLMEHYGADPTRLCTSPPGIDHSVFMPGDKAEAKHRTGIGDSPTILFVGRIQPLKGVDTAIRALARVTSPEPPQLIVIGGPSGSGGTDEVARLRQLVTDLDLDKRVHFVAPLRREQLVTFYQAADVLVMPSRSETFGLVAAEAQSCGVPVIATAVGGLPYIIEHEASGLLVTGHDPDDYAAALERVLNDPTLATRLGEGAFEHSQRFSWEATVARFLELYEGITGGA
jgi:D-inositol-3-phosphate glycosyltransferase